MLWEFLTKISNKSKQNKFGALYKNYRDFTMIPERVFSENLYLAERFSGIPGCVVECGVWRGGMSAGIAQLLGNDRTYYLFDSFEGLPSAKEIDGKGLLDYQKDTDSPTYFDNCKAEMEFSEKAMKLSGVTKYNIVKGWFKDTLPKFISQEPIAILRLDGDLYESTMDCLENLYPKVAKGGVIIIDDYYVWGGCTKAVHEYLSKHTLADKIYTSQKFSKGVCYIIKN